MFLLFTFADLFFVGGLALIISLTKRDSLLFQKPNVWYFYLMIYVIIYLFLLIGFFLQEFLPATIYVRENGIYSSRGMQLKFSNVRDYSLIPFSFQEEQVLTLIFTCQNDEQYVIELPSSISKRKIRNLLDSKVPYKSLENEVIKLDN